MGLNPGTRLGAFEIIGLLGAGGMGEVYRAVDPRVDRQVAIKVLPDAVAADPERTARFQREAKVLASLNHPRIAALFGLETDAARQFLVMELVGGDTLAERIARGPLPVDEALRIAIEVADGLEAAHETGIVHRDLKPANVKVTADERVKILDFGLARALEAPSVNANLTNSPTFSALGTQVGMILGTAAYMAPEQAKGLQADHRSDIFSFGVVLYEMLTGRNPFPGDTAPEVLASVLVREADFTALPANLNPRLLELLRRCLAKNPKKRWQAIGDVRAELETLAAEPRMPDASQHIVATPNRRRLAILILAGSLLIAAGSASMAWRLKPSSSKPQVARSTIPLGPSQVLSSMNRSLVALSPDGNQLVYVADRRLYRRALDEFDARAIPGTDGSTGISTPVFSPDGQSLVFWEQVAGTEGVLKRIPIAGGTAVTLGSTEIPEGMSWTQDTIFLAPMSRGIMRASATGGNPVVIVPVQDGEQLRGPHLLPDGDNLLFTVATTSGPRRWDRAQIVVQSLTTGDRKVVIDGGSDGRYVPTGHLVYAQEGTLFAVPFDVRRNEVRGGAIRIIEGVRRTSNGDAHFSFSRTGSLIFLPGPTSTARGQQDLALVERTTGTAAPLKLPLGTYQHARFSPDGTRVVFSINDGNQEHLGVYDLDGRTPMRSLTFGGHNRYPIWLDDQRIAFQSDREKDLAIFWQPADGSGAAERLTRPDERTSHVPESLSPDRNHLLYSVTDGTRTQLWVLSLKEKRAEPFADVESSHPIGAVFSPDGRWIAYSTSERPDNISDSLYVQRFPSTGEKHLVARPGHHPMWSLDGKELFFETGPNLLAVIPIETRPAFSPVGKPTTVPGGTLGSAAPSATRNRDIDPEGKRFITQVNGGTSDRPEIRLIQNWFEELKRLVPTN